MADINVTIEDAQPINVSLGEAVNVYPGGTGDYNDLNNLPDLTLKADKSDTYTKIEVDTSLAGKAEIVHVHAISDVTGLQTALDGKSATGHTHTAANVTDFDTEVSNNTDVAANTTARHTHANSAVLDATTASFTTADETKLDGIAAGAQVNTVTSVNTRTGVVVLDADDISDTATTNKFVTAAEKTKLSNLSGTNTGDQPLGSRTITGTTNQITVTNGDGVSGNPTLALPQDIHTGASPTFSLLTVNGTASGSTGSVVSNRITVKTATGTGFGSASMYLDNCNGQVFEFFCSHKGVFGVWDVTGDKEILGIAPDGNPWFSGHIIPNSNTYTVGTAVLYWGNTYTNRLTLNSTATIDGATAGKLLITGMPELATTGEGIVMKSPDGTRYKVTVANGGTLSVTAA